MANLYVRREVHCVGEDDDLLASNDHCLANKANESQLPECVFHTEIVRQTTRCWDSLVQLE